MRQLLIVLKKCCFKTDLSFTSNPQQIDQEFEDLLNTLSAEDFVIDTFIVFDDQVDTLESFIDPFYRIHTQLHKCGD